MATRRAEIGLGDWVRVLAELPTITPTEQVLVARCLGLQADKLESTHNERSTRGAWQRSPRKPEARADKPADKPITTPDTESQPKLPDEILPIRIEKLPNTLEAGLAPPLPAEIASQKPLELGASNHPPVPRHSLFPQRTARGLLAASVAQPSRGYDLDMPRLIRASVQRKPLRSLPLLPRFSTQQGCQLLLDFSEALVPWWDDMRDLIQQFHAVLGETACPVYEFTDNPCHAVRWTETGEQTWQAIAGKPVVIATDFGQVRTARHELRPGLSVWRDFALHCRRWQIPVIALTPLGHKRCPKELAHLMSIIDWNPHTRASDVKRLINHKQGIRQ